MGRLLDALSGPRLQAIAEFKRRSPSAGDIRPDADPTELARAYAANGAAAISVLCDERFAGSFGDLAAARAATTLPLLAKGFFSAREHLVSARQAGADAALLILRDLDDAAARAFLGWADELELDVLVEAHDREELERAVALDAQIVGVNARDLSTFAIDRRAQLELVARAPRDRVVVAESAVRSRAQAAAAELAGADGILVGTALMRARDPGAELAALLSRPLVKICGLTREEDVAAAAEAGADLAGFVLAESPRRAEAALPVPETMLSVGVYVGESAEDGTDLVQLYPEEDGHRGREGVLLRDGSEVARVLDLPWLGEDERHWETAARVDGRVLLAGGLSPENVGEAIARVRPWAVDASRSLERAPGVKDHDRVRDFVAAARGGAQ
jgi:indole-3-glycerol phosphate synthase / phosphoribosylanthranilate isomerase